MPRTRRSRIAVKADTHTNGASDASDLVIDSPKHTSMVMEHAPHRDSPDVLQSGLRAGRPTEVSESDFHSH